MRRGASGSDIDSEAADWAVRIDNELSDSDRETLEEWLRRDPRHVGALVRAQAIWVSVDHVGALQVGARKPQPVSARRPFVQYFGALAATLLAGFISISVYAYNLGRYASDHGEIRTVTLADGSRVVLDSDSTIKVHFNAKERSIDLLSGEASFKVAHNKAWPFVVRARDLAVRAVGTSFAVSLQPRQVSVTVAEGIVEIKDTEHKSLTLKRLVPRNNIFVAPAGGKIFEAKVAPNEVARRLSWQEGLLVFNGEDLAQAAAEVNRYATEPVVIDDDRLGARAFVGSFHVGNSKAFADSAAAAFDAKVSEEGGAFHLSRE